MTMKRLNKGFAVVVMVLLCCLFCSVFAFGVSALTMGTPTAQERITLEPPVIYNSQGQLAHRVLVSGSGLGRIAVVDENNNTLWELKHAGLWNEVNDADMLPNGDIIFCASSTGDCVVRLITPNYTDGTYTQKWEYKVPGGADNHTCQPIDDNGFLICEAYNDYVRIVELDANGNIRKTVGGKDMPIEGFSDATGGVHGKVRQIFKTDAGTYLLSHFTKELTVEVNDQGTVLHSWPYGGFTARKLANGNVLISGGDFKLVTELTEDGELVWQLNAKDIPGFELSFPANITRLPNGNTVIANWLGHGATDSIYPVAEVTPDKQVVWSLGSGDTAAVSNFMILDELNVSFKTESVVPDANTATGNYRSLLDAAASAVTGKVYVADYTNKSVQVIDSATNQPVVVIGLELEPNCVLVTTDGSKLYVGAGGAQGVVYEINTATNKVIATVRVGHTPTALALSADGKTLYAANRFTNDVSVVDLTAGTETGRIAATREPMGMVLHGNKLYVGGHLPAGTALEQVVASEMVVIDLAAGKVNKVLELPDGSTDLKDMAITPDGKYIYVTHTLGRYTVATTHLDRGWIYTNAISEISTADDSLTATVLVDDMNKGAGNPWGIVATHDTLYVTVAGTGELLVIDRIAMREKIDGVTNGTVYEKGYLTCKEDIANDLTFLATMKQRIDLGTEGPRGAALCGDQLYIANYFSGSVTCVDTNNLKKQTAIAFATSLEETTERLGEKLWNDATLCYQNWQSCASCHPDARVDGLNWDNLNDGIGTPKQAKSMLYTFERGRVMATGIRPDAMTAVRAGFKYILFNAGATDEQYNAIADYLKALEPVDSPYLVDGQLSENALKGRDLFYGKAGCASCHSSDVLSQDILVNNYTQTGIESRGLTVVPLVEVWRTAPYAYDGRFATILDFMSAEIPATAQKVNALTEQEKADLVEFVLSLSNEASLEKPDIEEPCQHDREEGWTYDDNGHWHRCKNCEDKGEVVPHVCDQEIAKDAYIAAPATCTEPAKYYKSCICGYTDKAETFDYGEALGHEYGDDEICDICGYDKSGEIAPTGEIIALWIAAAVCVIALAAAAVMFGMRRKIKQ